MRKNLIVILGPTASGKTALAARLAADMQGEIISADSRQVYRGMDIGTGKDLSEFQVGSKVIPYHLIDIIDPEDEFNAFEFQRLFYNIFDNLKEKKILPILVGGTGLYLESVLNGYDMPQAKPDMRLREALKDKSLKELQDILLSMKPDLHNKTDLLEPERILRKIEIEHARCHSSGGMREKTFMDACIFGIRWEMSALRRRIAVRLQRRMDEGMIDEVSRLYARGVTWERLDRFGLEYRYIAQYLQNIITREEMMIRLQIAIGQFAKRQMTWFRRMERKGVMIEWIAGDDYASLYRRATEVLS